MTTLVQLELTLEPVHLPWVEVALNGIKYAQQLTKETAFVFEFEYGGELFTRMKRRKK